MLRAWVSLRHKGETQLARRYDVLQVKLMESAARSETCGRLNALVENFRDDALEAQLRARLAAGEREPVITLPYATFNEAGEMTCRSTRYLNLDVHAEKENLLRADKRVAAVDARTVEVLTRDMRTKVDSKSLLPDFGRDWWLMLSGGPTIATIKPGGSGDFLTLQSWEDVLGSGEQEAEVFSGGSAGDLNLNDADPTSVRIFGASGHRPQIANLGTTGVANAGAFTTAAAIPITVEMLRLRRFQRLTTNLSQGLTRFEFCQFVNAVSSITLAVAPTITNGSTISSEVIVLGCVFYHATSSACLALGGPLANAASVVNLTGTIHRNTIIGTAASDLAVGCQLNKGTSTGTYNATLDIRGNAVFTAQAPCYAINNAGTTNVSGTSSHNASSDGSADLFGGSNHLENQIAADWFRSVSTDLRLKVGSPGIDAGVVVDGLAGDDIGADEFRHFLGSTLATRRPRIGLTI